MVDGRDTYTTVDVPIKPDVTSAENKLRAVLMVERSERRLLSRACLMSSAGLRVKMTTTLKMATRARTTKSSMRVKLSLLFLILIFVNIRNFVIHYWLTTSGYSLVFQRHLFRRNQRIVRWQCKRKNTASAKLGFNLHAPAMGAHNILSNIQSQPRTFGGKL